MKALVAAVAEARRISEALEAHEAEHGESIEMGGSA